MKSESVDRTLSLRGAGIGGPPWILGLRGSPLEAPENTLASLRRALELGLDGVAYDVRAAATGEAVLLRDETLDRTTDGKGRLADTTFPDLSVLDAGGWFRARFRGERPALLEEALELALSAEVPPRHIVWLREKDLVAEVVRVLRGSALAARNPKSVLVASGSRETCLEIRDAGLEAMLVVPRASEDARAFVRDERLPACAVESGGFATGADSAAWTCELWSLGADSPTEILEACRAPYTGIATREPLRAFALRALVALAPEYRGPFPLSVPELEVRPGEMTRGRGEWCGSWSCAAVVANPFPFEVEATAGVVPRHGAFDLEGLPRPLALAIGAEESVPFGIAGGSWRVGGDPLFFVLYRWKRAKGRRAGSLLLDAPLVRVRTATADARTQRLALLRESPGDPPASVVVRRRGRHFFVAIENAAGLESARTIVRLDGRFLRGGRGVRAVLPEDFDASVRGVPFSCGIEGFNAGERVVRRWAGGLEDEDGGGAPGRLLPRGSA